MKRIIALALAFAVLITSAFSAAALISPEDYPDFDFESDYDGSYSVAAYKGEGPDVVIPEYVYDRLVKRVEENAFLENDKIVNLYFHDGMTNVLRWAVRQCSNLEYIRYSKNFAAFWDYAFAYNTKLTSALIRNVSLGTMYQGCYYGDTSLKYIALPDGLETIGSTALGNTALEIVVIPSSVKSIGARCFMNDKKLKKVYIPASVTDIGANLFMLAGKPTVYTTEGSTAYDYCVKNNINVEVIGENDFPSDKMGDVNFDGTVDERDLDTMKSELNGEEVDFNARNCDMNGDFRFDSDDVTYLQNELTTEYTIVYNYKSYTDNDKYEKTTRTINITSYKSDIKALANQYMPAIKSPYVKYSIDSVSRSDDTITVKVDDAPRYYTVNFNGDKSQYRYKQSATLTTDEDSYFVTDGRAVAHGKSYSFYVTSDTEITTESAYSGDDEDISLIDFNSFQINDDKITLELLATADVSSFKRMGVAFALGECDKESISSAALTVNSGTEKTDDIVIHCSQVSKPNKSGQYQFIFAPYSSLENAQKMNNLYFYTYSVTENNEVVISDGVKVDIKSALA